MKKRMEMRLRRGLGGETGEERLVTRKIEI